MGHCHTRRLIAILIPVTPLNLAVNPDFFHEFRASQLLLRIHR